MGCRRRHNILKNGHLLDMDFVCRQMLWKYIFTPIPNCLHMICNLVNFNSDIHLTPNFCCYKIIRQNICYIVLTDNTWIYISHLKTFDNIMLDHKDKSNSMLRHLSQYKNKTFITKSKNMKPTMIGMSNEKKEAWELKAQQTKVNR